MASREMASGSGDSESLFRSDRLFHACLEIAATCPARQDSSLGDLFAQRIAQEERRLIEQTFELLETQNVSSFEPFVGLEAERGFPV